MEFTKDIHFNNILSANKISKITYSGELYTKNSQAVHIVYGFGENWDHTSEKEMEKTNTGFSTSVEMKDGYDTFNFCFRNGNYEWDNNHSFNYISPIQPSVSEKESTESTLKEKSTETTENIVSTETESSIEFDVQFILEVLDELLQENFKAIKNISVTETTDDKQQILEDILTENNDTIETVNPVHEFNMDKLVEEILNPVVNFDTTSEITTEIISETSTVEPTVETESTSTALTTTSSVEDTYLVSPRKLRKFYLLSKKIKLAFYKLFVAIPKLLSGNLWEDNNN